MAKKKPAAAKAAATAQEPAAKGKGAKGNKAKNSNPEPEPTPDPAADADPLSESPPEPEPKPETETEHVPVHTPTPELPPAPEPPKREPTPPPAPQPVVVGKKGRKGRLAAAAPPPDPEPEPTFEPPQDPTPEPPQALAAPAPAPVSYPPPEHLFFKPTGRGSPSPTPEDFQLAAFRESIRQSLLLPPGHPIDPHERSYPLTAQTRGPSSKQFEPFARPPSQTTRPPSSYQIGNPFGEPLSQKVTSSPRPSNRSNSFTRPTQTSFSRPAATQASAFNPARNPFGETPEEPLPVPRNLPPRDPLPSTVNPVFFVPKQSRSQSSSPAVSSPALSPQHHQQFVLPGVSPSPHDLQLPAPEAPAATRPPQPTSTALSLALAANNQRTSPTPSSLQAARVARSANQSPEKEKSLPSSPIPEPPGAFGVEASPPARSVHTTTSPPRLPLSQSAIPPGVFVKDALPSTGDADERRMSDWGQNSDDPWGLPTNQASRGGGWDVDDDHHSRASHSPGGRYAGGGGWDEPQTRVPSPPPAPPPAVMSNSHGPPTITGSRTIHKTPSISSRPPAAPSVSNAPTTTSNTTRLYQNWGRNANQPVAPSAPSAPPAPKSILSSGTKRYAGSVAPSTTDRFASNAFTAPPPTLSAANARYRDSVAPSTTDRYMPSERVAPPVISSAHARYTPSVAPSERHLPMERPPMGSSQYMSFGMLGASPAAHVAPSPSVQGGYLPQGGLGSGGQLHGMGSLGLSQPPRTMSHIGSATPFQTAGYGRGPGYMQATTDPPHGSSRTDSDVSFTMNRAMRASQPYAQISSKAFAMARDDDSATDDDYAPPAIPQFIESRGDALKDANRALFGNHRPASERLFWIMPYQHDPRVESLIDWVGQMQVGLAYLAVRKVIETGSLGALMTNANFRPWRAPDEPAFDWITFDQAQKSMDKTLQESIALYDPSVQCIVFVFLVSKSGNSMAIWRRRFAVPPEILEIYGTQLDAVKKRIAKRKHPVYVEALPPPEKPMAAQMMSPPAPAPKKGVRWLSWLHR